MAKYRSLTLLIGIISLLVLTQARHQLREHSHHPNYESLFKPRVVGGTDIKSTLITPYVVSLQISGVHTCSGAILNERWIITSASCVKDTNFVVWAGIYDLRHKKDAKKYKPLEVIVHCNFFNPKLTNDIALIRTTEKIVFGRHIKFITLATEVPLPGTKLHFSGWGASKYGSTSAETHYPNILKSLYYNAISHSTCNKAWKRKGGIDAGNVCGQSPKGTGACIADSGGPLVNEHLLLGVSSYVMPCAMGAPDVFSSIPFYYDFIRTTISKCDSYNELFN